MEVCLVLRMVSVEKTFTIETKEGNWVRHERVYRMRTPKKGSREKILRFFHVVRVECVG